MQMKKHLFVAQLSRVPLESNTLHSLTNNAKRRLLMFEARSVCQRLDSSSLKVRLQKFKRKTRLFLPRDTHALQAMTASERNPVNSVMSIGHFFERAMAKSFA